MVVLTDRSARGFLLSKIVGVIRSPAPESIGLIIVVRVRFRRSATPFCSGVYAVVVSNMIPLQSTYFKILQKRLLKYIEKYGGVYYTYVLYHPTTSLSVNSCFISIVGGLHPFKEQAYRQ
jgi:hypothetical protein